LNSSHAKKLVQLVQLDTKYINKSCEAEFFNFPQIIYSF